MIWVFLICAMVGVAQLVFVCILEEIFPYVTADLVCLWEDVSSGSSYVTVLSPAPEF